MTTDAARIAARRLLQQFPRQDQWSAFTWNGLHKTAGFIRLNPMSLDQKTVAERHWQKPRLASKPQKACDHGLFSDEAMQLDLVEMLMEPVNES